MVDKATTLLRGKLTIRSVNAVRSALQQGGIWKIWSKNSMGIYVLPESDQDFESRSRLVPEKWFMRVVTSATFNDQ